MFMQILNTWTICILLPVLIPSFSLGGPVNSEGIKEEIEPKTMYDAVAKKCPNLERFNLTDNEIFTKRCLNWIEISATTLFSEKTKNNVGCLVFYEALVSFCTNMGDNLLKFDGIIPTTLQLQKFNYNLQTVCNGSYSLYPINKTEHNISSLIRNSEDCFILCPDFTESHVSDICKFAYYFSNLNVTKLIHNFEVAHKNHDNSKTVQAQETLKNNPNPPVLIPANAQQMNKPSNQISGDTPEKTAVHAPVPKQQETDHVEKEVPDNSNHKEDHQAQKEVPDSSVHKKEPQPENKPDQEPNQLENDIKAPKPPRQQETQNNPSVVAPGKSENVPENTNHKDLEQAKGDVNAENRLPRPVPEKEERPEIKERPQPDGEENPEYIAEEKSQMANGDGPETEGLGDDVSELEQGDGDGKAEPVMPEEHNEVKTSSKKVKPSTVEDEAVSNLSTPEDDMDGDSYFFSYFTVIMCLFIVGYVGYHNRQKVLALILEGKKGRRTGRSRRPNSANYHKLDTNLEEAISSSCTKNASNVIY